MSTAAAPPAYTTPSALPKDGSTYSLTQKSRSSPPAYSSHHSGAASPQAASPPSIWGSRVNAPSKSIWGSNVAPANAPAPWNSTVNMSGAPSARSSQAPWMGGWTAPVVELGRETEGVKKGIW